MLRDARPDRLFARFVRRGDVRALGAVFDAVAPELLRIATHMVGDREAAQDLVQEAFVVALQRREDFAREGKVVPWLCGIIANLARNERRRAARRPAGRADRPPIEPREAAEQREFGEAFAAAKRALPEVYRPVVELHLEHGLTAAEIASVLERPAGTVRTQVVRGVELLRRRLPRGFVAGVAVLPFGPHVVETMRAAVLRRATDLVGAASTGGVVGTTSWLGATVMTKKVVLGAACGVVLVSLGLWASGVLPSGWTSAPRAPDSVGRMVADGSPGAASVGVTPDATETRREVAAGTTVEAKVGTLIVQARWQADDAPAVRQAIEVVYEGAALQELAPLRAITDAQGACTFEQVPVGAVSVQASTGDAADVEIVAGDPARVALELRGHAVEGVVLDPRGAPVPGARVWVSSELRYHETGRHNPPGHGQYGEFTLVADADGRFATRMRQLQCVAAFKDGYGPSRTVYPRFGVGTPQGPVEVTLRLRERGGTMLATVRGLHDQPVADALLLVGPEIPFLTGEDDFATTPALRVTTDADGRAIAAPLPAKKLPVVVRAAGYAPWRGEIDLSEAESARLDVTLTRGTVVHGVVTDDRQRPVAGALVHHGIPSKLRSSRVVTGADGAFRLEHLPAGEVDVVAVHRDLGIAKATLTLAAGTEHVWRPALSRRPAITGYLLGIDGRPVADAYVSSWSPAAERSTANAHTDEQGRFFLGPLSMGHGYAVRAEIKLDSGGVVAVSQRDVMPETEVVLRASEEAKPTARMRGRVLREDGSPAAGMVLSLQPLDNEPGYAIGLEADGTFEVGPWAPKRLRVTVHKSGLLRPAADFGVHEMQAFQTVDLGDLRIPTPGSARVRLVGPDASKGVLTLFSNGSFASDMRIAAREMEWPDLPPGEYRACVRRGGKAPLTGAASFRVVSGQNVEVEVTVGAARWGKLKFVGGGARPGGRVYFAALDAQRRARVIDTFGLPAAGAVERVMLPDAATLLTFETLDGYRGQVELGEPSPDPIEVTLSR